MSTASAHAITTVTVTAKSLSRLDEFSVIKLPSQGYVWTGRSDSGPTWKAQVLNPLWREMRFAVVGGEEGPGSSWGDDVDTMLSLLNDRSVLVAVFKDYPGDFDYAYDYLVFPAHQPIEVQVSVEALQDLPSEI